MSNIVSDKQFAYRMEGFGIRESTTGTYRKHILSLSGAEPINLKKIKRLPVPPARNDMWTRVIAHTDIGRGVNTSPAAMQHFVDSLLEELSGDFHPERALSRTMRVVEAYVAFARKAAPAEGDAVSLLLRGVDEHARQPETAPAQDAFTRITPLSLSGNVRGREIERQGEKYVLWGEKEVQDTVLRVRDVPMDDVLEEILKSDVSALSDKALRTLLAHFSRPAMDMLLAALENTPAPASGDSDAARAAHTLGLVRRFAQEAVSRRLQKYGERDMALADGFAAALKDEIRRAENNRVEEARAVAEERRQIILTEEREPLLEKFSEAAAAAHLVLPPGIREHCRELLVRSYLQRRPYILGAMQRQGNTEEVDREANAEYVRRQNGVMDTVIKEFLEDLTATASATEKATGMYAGCVNDLAAQLLQTDFRNVFSSFVANHPHLGQWRDLLEDAVAPALRTRPEQRMYATDFQELPRPADTENPVEKGLIEALAEFKHDLRHLDPETFTARYGEASTSGEALLRRAMGRAALAAVKTAWERALAPLGDLPLSRTAQQSLLLRLQHSALNGFPLNPRQIRGLWSMASTLRRYLEMVGASAGEEVRHMLSAFVGEQNRLLGILSPDPEQRRQLRDLALDIAFDLLREPDTLASAEKTPDRLLRAARGAGNADEVWKDPALAARLLPPEVPAAARLEEAKAELQAAGERLETCSGNEARARSRKEVAEALAAPERAFLLSQEREGGRLEALRKETDTRITALEARREHLLDQQELLRDRLNEAIKALSGKYTDSLRTLLHTLDKNKRKYEALQDTYAKVRTRIEETQREIQLLSHSKAAADANRKKISPLEVRKKELRNREKKLVKEVESLLSSAFPHPDILSLAHAWSGKEKNFGVLHNEEDFERHYNLLAWLHSGEPREDIAAARGIKKALRKAREAYTDCGKTLENLRKERADLERSRVESADALRRAGKALEAAESLRTAALREARAALDTAVAAHEAAVEEVAMLERQVAKLHAAGRPVEGAASPWQRLEKELPSRLSLGDGPLEQTLRAFLSALSPVAGIPDGEADAAVMRGIEMRKQDISPTALRYGMGKLLRNPGETAARLLEKHPEFGVAAPLLRQQNGPRSPLGQLFSAEVKALLADLADTAQSGQTWRHRWGIVFSETQLLETALRRAAEITLKEYVHSPELKYDMPKTMRALRTLADNGLDDPDMTVKEANCAFVLRAGDILSELKPDPPRRGESRGMSALLALAPALTAMRKELDALFPVENSASRDTARIRNKHRLWRKAGLLLKDALPPALREALADPSTPELCRHLESIGGFAVRNGKLQVTGERFSGDAEPVRVSDQPAFEPVRDLLDFCALCLGAPHFETFSYPPSMAPGEAMGVMKTLMQDFAMLAEGIRTPLFSAARARPARPLDKEWLHAELERLQAIEHANGLNAVDSPRWAATRILLNALGMINIAESMGGQVNGDLVLRILAGAGTPPDVLKRDIAAAYPDEDIADLVSRCLDPDATPVSPEERIVHAARRLEEGRRPGADGVVRDLHPELLDFLLPADGDGSAVRQLRGESERLWKATSVSMAMQRFHNDLYAQAPAFKELSPADFLREMRSSPLPRNPTEEERRAAAGNIHARLVRRLHLRPEVAAKIRPLLLAAGQEYDRLLTRNAAPDTASAFLRGAAAVLRTEHDFPAFQPLLSFLEKGETGDGTALFDPLSPANRAANAGRLDRHLREAEDFHTAASRRLAAQDNGRRLIHALRTAAEELLLAPDAEGPDGTFIAAYRERHSKNLQRIQTQFRIDEGTEHLAAQPRRIEACRTALRTIGECIAAARASGGERSADLFEKEFRSRTPAVAGGLGADPAPMLKIARSYAALALDMLHDMLQTKHHFSNKEEFATLSETQQKGALPWLERIDNLAPLLDQAEKLIPLLEGMRAMPPGP